MDKRIALLAIICLIVTVAAALVIFYTTKFSAPENKTPDADSIVWQTQFNHTVSHYIADEGKIFLTDKEGNVYSYNASTGESIWKTNVDSDRGYRPIIAAGGKVYVSAGQTVLRINEDTHQLDMQYMISSTINEHQFGKVASFSIEDQKLIVNYDNQGKAVYDLASGQPLWSTHPNLGFQVYNTTTTESTESGVLHIDYDAESLTAIDLNNGSTIWNYSGACGNPVFTEDRVILLNYASLESYRATVSSGQNPTEHTIVCLDRATGQKLWTSNPQFLIFNPTVYGNSLLFASYDGCFYSLNINNGTTQWKTQIADLRPTNNNSALASLSTCLITQPLIDEKSNTLFWLIASNKHGNSDDTRDYYVRSIDLQNGDEKWSSPLDPTYVTVIGGKSNAVLLNNHFFVKEDFKVLCLDASSGTALWKRGNVQQDAYPLLDGDKVVAIIDNYIVAYK